jgi:hypothetical protein
MGASWLGKFKVEVPDFIDAPLEEWPECAIIFYRLVLTAAKRVVAEEEKKRLEDASKQPPD